MKWRMTPTTTIYLPQVKETWPKGPGKTVNYYLMVINEKFLQLEILQMIIWIVVNILHCNNVINVVSRPPQKFKSSKRAVSTFYPHKSKIVKLYQLITTLIVKLDQAFTWVICQLYQVITQVTCILIWYLIVSSYVPTLH